MKIKPLYIYAGLILLAIIFLIIFTPGDSPKKDSGNQAQTNSGQMPQDEVHKGLEGQAGGPAPSGSNVNERVKQQMEVLRKEYEKNPNDTLKAREYAEFMAAAHRPNEAAAAFEKILQKDSRRTDIRFSLALIYYNKQDYKKAEEIVRAVLNYDKKNAMAKFNLGAIAATSGDKQKAKVYWEEVKKENPGSTIATDADHAIKTLGQ